MGYFFSIIAVILTFAGYVPYIRDTFRGKTKPHVYSWFVWGLVAAIAFSLQISDKAGPGAYVTLAAAIMLLFIAFLGLKYGEKNITFTDNVFLGLSVIAVLLWLVAKQPVISVVLVTMIDLLAFAPTIRKSWSKPYEETLMSYMINNIRFTLAILALGRFTIITAFYPVLMLISGAMFCLFLFVRRKQVKVIDKAEVGH